MSICDKGHFGDKVNMDCRIAVSNRSYDRLKFNLPAFSSFFFQNLSLTWCTCGKEEQKVKKKQKTCLVKKGGNAFTRSIDTCLQTCAVQSGRHRLTLFAVFSVKALCTTCMIKKDGRQNGFRGFIIG